jgi:hypothetical protein
LYRFCGFLVPVLAFVMAANPTQWPQASVDALMRIHDPQLCLNDSNHSEWLQGLTAHLMRVQMDDILECNNPAAAAFRVFKGFIAVHVPKSLVHTVRAAASPPALMSAIASEFAPSSTVHVVTMRTQLSQLKQGPVERVSKYIDRARGILRDLQAAGDTTNEAFVVTQLLMGLRTEFQDEAKHMQRSNVPHTFADIAQPLRDAERTMVAVGSIVYPDSQAAVAPPPAGLAASFEYHAETHTLDEDPDVLFAAGVKRRKGGQGRPIPSGGDTRSGQGRPVQSGQAGPSAAIMNAADAGNLITPELIAQALQIALSRLDKGGGARRGPAPGGNRHDPNIVCLRCHERGHIARDCMAVRPVNVSQGNRAPTPSTAPAPHHVHFAMPSLHDLPGPLTGAPESHDEQVQGEGHAH